MTAPVYNVTLSGTDTARFGALTVTGGKGGPICRIARMMKSEGIEPGVLSIVRDTGTPVFARNMSLDWWASKSTSEPNNSSVKLVKYAPDPRFGDQS